MFCVEDVAGEKTEPVAIGPTGERESLKERDSWAQPGVGARACGVFRRSWSFSASGVGALRGKGRERAERPAFLTLSHSFLGRTTCENSSPRSQPAGRSSHQRCERAGDTLLADPIAVQTGAAGEIRLASFSTGLSAQPTAQRNSGPELERN